MTRITLITRADCPLCDHAKSVLDRVAADYPVQVELAAVETPRGRQLAVTAGMAFPPGVLVDGEPFAYGRLSERRLRRRLDQLTVR